MCICKRDTFQKRKKKNLTQLPISADLKNPKSLIFIDKDNKFIFPLSYVKIKKFSNVYTCRCFEARKLFLSNNH